MVSTIRLTHHLGVEDAVKILEEEAHHAASCRCEGSVCAVTPVAALLSCVGVARRSKGRLSTPPHIQTTRGLEKCSTQMLPNPLYAECVTRAAELLGGLDRLARELYLTPRVLVRWIDGRSNPPTGIFLRLVDILLDENVPSNETNALSLNAGLPQKHHQVREVIAGRASSIPP
jgi:hypothetical protein